LGLMKNTGEGEGLKREEREDRKVELEAQQM
jgi:hypothetical protein